MRRRDFVKAIVAVPVAAMPMFGQNSAPAQTEKTSQSQSTSSATAPPTSVAGSKRIDEPRSFGFQSPSIPSTIPDEIATTQQHYFHAEQMATLRKLGDILLPPMNGYPGSTQAYAPEFLDFLISVSPVERQEMYRSGLDRLNAEAHKQFGIPFAHIDEQQADLLLRPWLRTWMTDHPPTEPYAHFINVAHQDIRTATLNSQTWSIAATSAGERAPGIGWYWSPIDPDIQMYV